MTVPSKHHSSAVKYAAKYAAVLLARESGVESAADAFGIYKRTVARWLDKVELPDDDVVELAGELPARREGR